MSTTKHTPGKWRVSGLEIQAPSRNGGPSALIADLTESPLAVLESEANARLIASAPDLFAKLKNLVSASCAIEEAKSTASDDALTCLEGRLEQAIEQAQSAIASASV